MRKWRRQDEEVGGDRMRKWGGEEEERTMERGDRRNCGTEANKKGKIFNDGIPNHHKFTRIPRKIPAEV